MNIYISESDFGILIPQKEHRSNSSLRTITSMLSKPFSDVYIFTKIVGQPKILRLLLPHKFDITP
jgi:hypothetical protein